MAGGLGLQGAYGLSALRAGIHQRLQEEAAARQREFMNSIESRRMANAEQQTLQGGEQNKFNAESLAFARGQTALNNDLTQTEKIDEATPPGFLPQDSPIAGRLVKIGAATPQAERPRIDEGPLLPGDTGAAMPQGYMKRPTMKQSDTMTDNARQAAQLKQQGENQDWKNTISQQLADVKAGQQPKTPDPQPQTFYDENGTPHAIQFVGGQAREVPLPPGIAGKAPLKPVATRLGTTSQQMADMDTALQEAHRLQDILKKARLENDNNPIGPRTAAALAAAGINPGELPGDLAQGAKFTKAELFLGLARGSGIRGQQLQQELGAHLPDNIQTHKQLSEVLRFIDREYMNKRHNTLRAHGVKDEEYPFEDVYRQKQDAGASGGATSPNRVVYDSNGNPVKR